MRYPPTALILGKPSNSLEAVFSEQTWAHFIALGALAIKGVIFIYSAIKLLFLELLWAKM